MTVDDTDNLDLPTLADLCRNRPTYLDEAITAAAASAITGDPVSTLATRRSRGGGPEFLKLGPGKSAPIRYLPVQKVEDITKLEGADDV